MEDLSNDCRMLKQLLQVSAQPWTNDLSLLHVDLVNYGRPWKPAFLPIQRWHPWRGSWCLDWKVELDQRCWQLFGRLFNFNHLHLHKSGAGHRLSLRFHSVVVISASVLLFVIMKRCDVSQARHMTEAWYVFLFLSEVGQLGQRQSGYLNMSMKTVQPDANVLFSDSLCLIVINHDCN